MTSKTKPAATAKGHGNKAATETTKPAVKAKAEKKAAPTGKLSQMAAGVRVLAEAGEPMNCKLMVEAMSATFSHELLVGVKC